MNASCLNRLGFLTWKLQLDAPSLSSKAGQRRGLLPARRNNAAGRVGRGAIGCTALAPIW